MTKHLQTAKTRAILNLAGFTGVVVVNILADALPINGLTTGEISDLYPNLFTPAGFTFSVWGLIYLLLAAFTVYSLVQVHRRNETVAAHVNRIGAWFFISCLANIGWIFAWHGGMLPVSVAVMLLLLLSLCMIYVGLRKQPVLHTRAEHALLRRPFSVYLGWITVATMANITALLVHLEWDGWGLGDDFWLSTLLVVAILLTLYIGLKKSDGSYTAVVIWALIGIVIQRNREHTTHLTGFYIAVTGIALLSFVLLYRLARMRR